MRRRLATGAAVVGLGALALGVWLTATPGGRNLRQRLEKPAFLDPPALDFDGPEVRVAIELEPLRVSVEGGASIEVLDAHRVRLRSDSGHLVLPLAPGEALYGLTARTVRDRERSEWSIEEVGGLDRRGEIVDMWVLPTEAIYAPFVVSSRGWGLLIEGSSPGVLDLGATEPDVLRARWHAGDAGLSAVVFEGPDLLALLDRYTAHTGRPILPPRWVFLPWKWRDEHRAGRFAELDGVRINAEVAEDVLRYEELGLPVGVYMIDRPWARGSYGYGTLDWDPGRFPNGDEMVRVLQERGWRVVVWAGPWALGHRDFELGSEARARGYLIGSRNIDYTDPAAVAWQREKVEAFARRSGIDGWKLDRGDEYNPSGPDDRYHDGRSGLEVHNDYPRLYIRTFHDAMRALRGDDFVIKARPAYTGTTRWSIVWGGDTLGAVGLLSPRGTDLGLRSGIIGLLRAAFMGYPVYGTDTGGYRGFRDREVFARWLAFSAFCPLMEIGGMGSHEPWAMPAEPRYDEEMIAIYRRYTWLHARLADYTYALARRAHESGSPIVHPLVLDWPDDPNVRDLWDQYMYGPALMVAPVWRLGQRERDVYLPRGEWIDLWDRDRRHVGPVTLRVEAPLERIPAYVRAGREALLPDGLLDGL